jgi:murein tripeptide amidase MpaA
LEGFIDVVLKHPKLLQKFIFIIVPMLNPDGVFFGNHRTGVLGQDLNRHFDTDDDEFFPEIVALKKLVRSTRRRGKVRFLFDLHGHSSKKGVFAYAAGEDKKSSRFVYSILNINSGRIIPKLLEKQFSLFDYDGCVFKNSK